MSCAASPFFLFGEYRWVNRYTISYVEIDILRDGCQIVLTMTNGQVLRSDGFPTYQDAHDWVEKTLMPKTE